MKRVASTLVLLALSACGASQQDAAPPVTRRRAAALENQVSRDDHSRCDARLPHCQIPTPWTAFSGLPNRFGPANPFCSCCSFYG